MLCNGQSSTGHMGLGRQVPGRAGALGHRGSDSRGVRADGRSHGTSWEHRDSGAGQRGVVTPESWPVSCGCWIQLDVLRPTPGDRARCPRGGHGPAGPEGLERTAMPRALPVQSPALSAQEILSAARNLIYALSSQFTIWTGYSIFGTIFWLLQKMT